MIDYSSNSDQLMLDHIKKYLLNAYKYISFSIIDLVKSIYKCSGILWVSLIATGLLTFFIHINFEEISQFRLNEIFSKFTYQLIAGFIIFFFIYRIRTIVSLVWLACGPNLRWMRVFLLLESVSIAMLVYGLLPETKANIAHALGSVSAAVAVLVSVVGGVRQWLFDRNQRQLLLRSTLAIDRVVKADFNIMGQQGSIKRLKNIIVNEREVLTPVTVLIDGKWGDGKTHIVNQVITSPELSYNYLLVRFEPWRHASEEAIVTSFYSSLGSELSNLPGSAGIKFDIAAFSRNFVSKIDKTGTIESILTQLPQKSSSDLTLKRVDKLLTDTNRRLLFVIDDVERCSDKERILRTLQLGLHLGSDIKNSTTIIIGDVREIISLTEINETFLQKVFDEQITVLPPTKKEMLDITNELMKNLSFDIQITQDERLDLLIRNVRGVKRVLYGLRQDYMGIGDNIHPQDMFTMNVIKHAFPTVYSDIMHNRKFYVPYQYSDYTDEEFLIYGFGGEREDSDFISDQVEHFNKLFANLNLTDIGRRRLISVLEQLFPATRSRFNGDTQSNHDTNSRQHRRERRIGTSRDYIDRYFLLSGDVDKRHIIENSQAALRETYFGEQDDEIRIGRLKTLVDVNDKDSEELFYGGLADILVDLNHDDGNRKILARDMLRLYFRDTGYVVKDDRRTLLIILDAINNYIDNDDYIYVFDGIANYMEHPSTGLRLLLYMNPTRDNSFYDLKHYPSYGELRKDVLKRVDDYYLLKGNDVIDEDRSDDREWRFIVAQWSTSVCCDSQNDFIESRFNKVNNYLIDITSSSAKKFRDVLMDAFWHHDLMDRKSKFNFKITPQAYDAKKFASQARKFIKNPAVSSDIQDDLHGFLRAYSDYMKQIKKS